ncbi:MAG TPA: AAA family ATPase [Vampirovibrionales bacterium]
MAKQASAEFIELSAVSSGIKDLRAAIDQAKENLKFHERRTIIFIDEIHRYSKTQQDAILGDLEQGNIILIGATTENPSFQVVPALLSRLLLIRLQPHTQDSLKLIISKGTKELKLETLEEEVVKFILRYASGDARSALNLLEVAAKCTKPIDGKKVIKVELLEQIAQQNRINYDKDGDNHYDLASAYQKSMRGGDANAALYWLAKMIVGGEDPRFIARRLMVCASEDVGNADPQAFILASATYNAIEKLGWPEARIPLSQTTVYVAQAPKSNKSYKALDKAIHAISKEGKNYSVPSHLKDAHYKDASKYGHGEGYIYSHSNPEAEQTFMPEELLNTQYLE